MNRRHNSSARVHFGKPILEALEDRVLLSQLGETLSNFGLHAVDTYKMVQTSTFNLQSLVGIQAGIPFSTHVLNVMLDEVGDLSAQANQLQQQSQFFTVSLLQGITQGRLELNELGPLLDQAITLSVLAAQAQAQSLQAQGVAVDAAILFGLSNNFSPASTDLASNFDFNALADEVVGAIV